MKKYSLLVMLLSLAGVSLFIGVQSIPVSDVFQLNDNQSLVLWSTRVPRTVSLIIAGATSAVCGLIMQHLTQNKFVSPTTAGTMDSARLGILVAMVFFPNGSTLVRSFVAFIFAFLGTVLFIQLIQRLPQKNQVMVPLVGLMFGNIVGSVVTFFAYQLELIQNMSSWLQGNFSVLSRGGYELIYLTVPLLIVAYFYAYHFTIAGMGKDLATGIGLNYQVIQLFGLGLVALASSLILVTIGGLPFLGVIIPNIVSLYFGDQMKQTIWVTAGAGSCFLIICDIISRLVIAPYEVPVSLTVGVIGSVIFIILLLKGAKK
ncbi:iron chelate uptake ABC transporter family permease subunit [Vagococcus coleopterorum]|uniref:Iron chelate uptake ABC transporter family permease subunit n=1 Tax=Vagococcus coleopterorum TaxID=2714946 RepID=A0A6G8AM01_9ENTE|nr:iron chelate uptake ABC transporter family permease subunit [Vagococcus coleopterorum]QIL46088.1 iron chelate uptake ABC transporter family permease subunit [Vagococcus coleopterorum]